VPCCIYVVVREDEPILADDESINSTIEKTDYVRGGMCFLTGQTIMDNG
jgi:hypothetical protein